VNKGFALRSEEKTNNTFVGSGCLYT